MYVARGPSISNIPQKYSNSMVTCKSNSMATFNFKTFNFKTFNFKKGPHYHGHNKTD